MNLREETARTVFDRIPSKMGDVILQRDSLARDDTIIHREIVMYVPQSEQAGENVCSLSCDS